MLLRIEIGRGHRQGQDLQPRVDRQELAQCRSRVPRRPIP
jgi:hypothetical protein